MVIQSDGSDYFYDCRSVLQAIAEQSTSAYPSIKASDIEDLEISIPDITTQKRIADILSSLDKKSI